jgi:hypothetical protein
MTVRSDDASADRAALVRLLDGFLSPDYPGRWWEYKVLLAEALRPGGPRAIHRGHPPRRAAGGLGRRAGG